MYLYIYVFPSYSPLAPAISSCRASQITRSKNSFMFMFYVQKHIYIYISPLAPASFVNETRQPYTHKYMYV